MSDPVDYAEHQPTMRLVPRREHPVPDDRLDIFNQSTEPVPPAEPPPPPTPRKRKPTIEERFQQHLKDHPEFLDEFVRLARLAVERGRGRVGAKAIAEVVRWHFIIDKDYDIETNPAFGVNNVLVSRYSRHAMENYPDLAGLFETRELKAR